MALAHPVSRKAFFLAKTAGAFLAYLVFALATSAVVALVVNGAEIGGIESARKGDISRIWGPSLVLAVASFMMPVVIGGLLNRFARCRFTLSAFAFALAVPLASLGYRPNAELLFRLAPVMVTLVVHAAVLLSASAAFAVRWKANGAASAVGLLFLAALPFAGNYYLADALSKGGSVSWGYVGFATLGALPALVAFLLLGAHMISTRDPA